MHRVFAWDHHHSQIVYRVPGHRHADGQTTIVSIKGSTRDVKPSAMGFFVLEALCAIAADPTPASLEKAARCNPTISTPIKPPFIALAEKAPSKMA